MGMQSDPSKKYCVLHVKIWDMWLFLMLCINNVVYVQNEVGVLVRPQDLRVMCKDFEIKNPIKSVLQF